MSVYGGPFADGRTRRTFINRKGKLVYSPYGNRYKFNNKPNALAHWAERPKAERDQAGPAGNEAVVLVDPDFLFLARFKLPVD
mmetsp:Transcript_64956/g.146537  ORF Transcript_64956/g.146537 Transcript_64956/m.146537 type:complete len:83 (-) Transcript_64956:6-254(-)